MIIWSMILGAVVGYIVAMVLVALLFYPKRPARIGPISIQGVLRQAWPAILDRLGRLFKQDAKKLEDKVAGVDLSSDAAPLIDERMDRFFGGVVKQVPMAAALLQGVLAEQLKGQARDQILSLLPELQRKAAQRIAGEVDPTVILHELNYDEVECSLQDALHPNLRSARIIGAAIGALLGLLFALMLSLASYTGL